MLRGQAQPALGEAQRLAAEQSPEGETPGREGRVAGVGPGGEGRVAGVGPCWAGRRGAGGGCRAGRRPAGAELWPLRPGRFRRRDMGGGCCAHRGELRLGPAARGPWIAQAFNRAPGPGAPVRVGPRPGPGTARAVLTDYPPSQPSPPFQSPTALSANLASAPASVSRRPRFVAAPPPPRLVSNPPPAGNSARDRPANPRDPSS